jgi:hypothetical protein
VISVSNAAACALALVAGVADGGVARDRRDGAHEGAAATLDAQKALAAQDQQRAVDRGARELVLGDEFGLAGGRRNPGG